MTRNAAIYVRQSLDRSGEGLAVARQLAACRAKAAALGWTVAGVFEDNDTSASGRKPRPAYTRMLADLEAGKVDGVVVWDLDRLTRRPVETEAFIDLADRRGVALASVGGDVDLATDNGRLYARIKGAVARAEIERKSARQKAANDQRAAAGRPSSGRRPFGYEHGGEVVEHEAAEVRKAAETMLAGGTIRGISVDMNARGVRTTAGGPWRPTELRRLLGNPRYAGQRVHRGEVVGPGDWTPILDLDDFRALQGVLSDPARHRAGRPTRYLLSGIARCGQCGARIYGAGEPRRGRIYVCESRRHVSRRADPVDRLVVDMVLSRLTRQDARDVFARPDSRAEVQSMRQQEAALRSRLDGLAEAFAAGEVDREQLRAGSERLRGALADVVDRLASLAVTPAVSGLLGAEDVAAAWLDLGLDRQRAVVDTLVTIALHPPGQGVRTFDPRSVEIEWRA